MSISNLINKIGSGARTNKFRILIPIGDNGETFDILCQSASLPGKILTPVKMISKGRNYTLRGETSYDGNWSATIYNTDKMAEYKQMVRWMDEVHQHAVYREGILGGLTVGGVNVSKAAQGITSGINQAVNILSTNPLSLVGSIINGAGTYPSYMRNIRIQMLGGSDTKKYKQGFNKLGDNNDLLAENVIAEVLLLGVFPTSVSPIDLTSENGNISVTNIVFAYSDIQFGSDLENLLGDVLGTNLTKTKDNITNTTERF